jgi:hypothetical protein
MENIIIYQFFILLLGTLFAWYNFAVEFIVWRRGKTCSTDCACTSCGKGANPFKTPCFFGAIFFTLSFVLSALMYFN